MCCGVIVLLLFSMFGSLSIIPMFACNSIPDLVNLAVKDDHMINEMEKQLKSFSSDDMKIKYVKANNSIVVDGTIYDTKFDISVNVDDIVKGYLGGCKGNTAKPLYLLLLLLFIEKNQKIILSSLLMIY